MGNGTMLDLEDIAVGAHDHVVRFYERDSELSEAAGRYLIEGARAGEVAIVVATEAHHRAFDAELAAAGIDPAESRRAGALVSLDAGLTMARFIAEGRIDRDAFDRVIGTVVRHADESGRPVRVFGEMVSLLWDAGHVLTAIELEKLWNELRRDLRFSLLCAYRSESVSGSEHAESLAQVCHLHSSVLRSAESEVSGRFPAEHGAPGEARRLVAHALGRWGHGGAFADDAQLVVTELATNAVLHAGSEFSVLARAEDAGVWISVHDSSPLAPTVRDEGLMGASGRGLRLVAAIAVDWGVELTAEGKTVWAKLQP
jgi:anti-sigma regulatory factor (Ser/Thr protein kinase)